MKTKIQPTPATGLPAGYVARYLDGDVDELIETTRELLAVFGMLADHRHETLREADSECLKAEGIGFNKVAFAPQRRLEDVLRRIDDRILYRPRS